jgi:hypothetical protein
LDDFDKKYRAAALRSPGEVSSELVFFNDKKVN